MNAAHRIAPWLEALLVAVTALGLGASFGWNWAIGGHTCYLPLSLHFSDPSLLARDWYVTETTQYHPAYGYLGELLLSLSPNGWAFGIAQTLTIAAAAAGLYALARVLAGPRLALATYLVLTTIGFVTRWRGPGTTYVFDGVFQPSGVSSLFLVLAFAPFVQGRYLLSGMLLGLAGLFHLNLLVLGMGAFGLAHLFLGRAGLARRLAAQLALPAVVGAGFLPMMLRANQAPAGADVANWVFTHARNAHHFMLGRQWTSVPSLRRLGARGARRALAGGAAWGSAVQAHPFAERRLRRRHLGGPHRHGAA